MNKKIFWSIVCLVFLTLSLYSGVALAWYNWEGRDNYQEGEYPDCYYPSRPVGTGGTDYRCDQEDQSLSHNTCINRMCDGSIQEYPYDYGIHGRNGWCKDGCWSASHLLTYSSEAETYCDALIDAKNYTDPVWEQQQRDACRSHCRSKCIDYCEDQCDYHTSWGTWGDSYWLCFIARVDCKLDEPTQHKSNRILPFAPFPPGDSKANLSANCNEAYCCCDICVEWECLEWYPDPCPDPGVDCEQKCNRWGCKRGERWDLGSSSSHAGELDGGFGSTGSITISKSNTSTITILPFPAGCQVTCNPRDILPRSSGGSVTDYDCTYLQPRWNTGRNPRFNDNKNSYSKACLHGKCSDCNLEGRFSFPDCKNSGFWNDFNPADQPSPPPSS